MSILLYCKQIEVEIVDVLEDYHEDGWANEIVDIDVSDWLPSELWLENKVEILDVGFKTWSQNILDAKDTSC